MIYIYDEKNNIYITLEGVINDSLEKRGFNEIMSTRGQYFHEHTRGVINITINVTNISEEEYKKLKLMFLNSTSNLYVEDDNTGVVYKDYFIKGNTLSFDKDEDLDTKTYFYKGTLPLNKR